MSIVLMFLITLTAVVADQVTKNIVLYYLKPVGSVPIIEGALHLTYSENTGAAFGMLKDARWVFMVFSVLAIIVILAYFFIAKPKTKPVVISLGMILGGGIGNMIDRIVNGYVIDFIDFRIINFAIFNVADSCITVGAVILILFFLISEIGPMIRKKKNASAAEQMEPENPVSDQTVPDAPDEEEN